MNWFEWFLLFRRRLQLQKFSRYFLILNSMGRFFVLHKKSGKEFSQVSKALMLYCSLLLRWSSFLESLWVKHFSRLPVGIKKTRDAKFFFHFLMGCENNIWSRDERIFFLWHSICACHLPRWINSVE